MQKYRAPLASTGLRPVDVEPAGTDVRQTGDVSGQPQAGQQRELRVDADARRLPGVVLGDAEYRAGKRQTQSDDGLAICTQP